MCDHEKWRYDASEKPHAAAYLDMYICNKSDHKMVTCVCFREVVDIRI